MPIPIKILKLAADLLDIINDQSCRSKLVDYYDSLDSQFGELAIPESSWISLRVPPYGPVYISDWRFCTGQGEAFETRIELGEIDKIDALNIDWEKFERDIYEKIKQNRAVRAKRIEEINAEVERLKNANERLEKLLCL